MRERSSIFTRILQLKEKADGGLQINSVKAEPLRNCIKKLRVEKGISQTMLSEMTGISRCTINKVENDTGDPSLRNAFQIARSLGGRVHEVFLFDG